MLAYKRFSKKEDEKLSKLVELYGTGKWKEVAKKMNGRTSRQCMDRYIRFLAPNLANREWTKEEDDMLLDLVPKLSPKWRFIASHFDGRSDIQIKNRYNKLLNRIKNGVIVQELKEEKSEPKEFKELLHPLDAFEYDDMFLVFEYNDDNIHYENSCLL